MSQEYFQWSLAVRRFPEDRPEYAVLMASNTNGPHVFRTWEEARQIAEQDSWMVREAAEGEAKPPVVVVVKMPFGWIGEYAKRFGMSP